MTWRILWRLGLLLLALSSGRVQAQAQRQDPPGYAEAVRRGLAELDAGNYPEAREEFMQAHKLYPNARTLRGLGMVEFEQRNYQECVRLLQEALTSEVKPLSGKLRDETEALLGRARRYLGELSLAVVPPSASVRVDGKPVERAQRRALLLEVGEHRLDVEAPGYRPEQQVFRTQGGVRLNIDLKLSALQDVGGAARPLREGTSRPGPASEVTPGYKKWWVWTTVAVLVVGGGVAAALLLTRDKEPRTKPVRGEGTVGPTVFALQRF
jgi:tetratricopeptide (TPR) repeat protein